MIVFIFVEQIESGTHERNVNCYNKCCAGWLHCVCVALIFGLYYIWTYNNICKLLQIVANCCSKCYVQNNNHSFATQFKWIALKHALIKL